MFAIDFLHTEPLLASRHYGCMRFTFLPFGISRSSPLALVLDFVLSSLSPLSQLLARSSPVTFVMNFTTLVLMLFVRSFACLELAIIAPDSASLDFILPLRGHSRLSSFIVVMDLGALDLILSMRLFACLGVILTAMNHVVAGTSPSIRSSTWSGSQLSTLDLLHTEMLSSFHQFGNVGSASFAFGMLQTASPPPTLNLVFSGMTSMLRFPTKPDLAIITPDYVHLDVSSFPRSLA